MPPAGLPTSRQALLTVRRTPPTATRIRSRQHHTVILGAVALCALWLYATWNGAADVPPLLREQSDSDSRIRRAIARASRQKLPLSVAGAQGSRSLSAPRGLL